MHNGHGPSCRPRVVRRNSGGAAPRETCRLEPMKIRSARKVLPVLGMSRHPCLRNGHRAPCRRASSRQASEPPVVNRRLRGSHSLSRPAPPTIRKGLWAGGLGRWRFETAGGLVRLDQIVEQRAGIADQRCGVTGHHRTARARRRARSPRGRCPHSSAWDDGVTARARGRGAAG
jgi:hypothetical protein